MDIESLYTPYSELQTYVGWTAEDAGMAIEVIDTVVGIPADQLSRVMELLYSAKARGLGPGLAMVKAIMEKHRGSLHIASVPGEGSTFTVRLTTSDTSTRSMS